MNVAAVQLALARHFDPLCNLMMFEVPVQSRLRRQGTLEESCTYLADLIVVTPADYATEIEVKVALGDWRSDADKRKWEFGLPEWISRFMYAVPVEFGIPPWVPPRAGVLHLMPVERDELYVRVARGAYRCGKEKVPQEIKEYIRDRAYVRYWQSQFVRLSIAATRIRDA